MMVLLTVSKKFKNQNCLIPSAATTASLSGLVWSVSKSISPSLLPHYIASKASFGPFRLTLSEYDDVFLRVFQ